MRNEPRRVLSGIALALAAGVAQGAPGKGRFWIDPERGAVLRTDVTYDTDVLDEEHRSREAAKPE